MSLLVVGTSYRTAPTALLEAVSAGVSDAGKVLATLGGAEHVAEAALLSTCNRVEVYADVTTFHGGHLDICDVLTRVSGLSAEELTPHLYVDYDARAVAHVFSVAAGLDSMLVGEAQIVGQLRAALRTAQDEGSVGRVVGELLRHALRVGKRVRTDTGIDRAGASLVGVGVQRATDALGSLAGARVLLVGAGATGSLAGTLLRRAGAGPVTVANRSPERGARLAATLHGTAVGLAALPAALAAADVVVSSTASTGTVLSAAQLAAALRSRPERPLVVLDLALPRDVEPAAAGLPGLTVVDLDALRAEVADLAAGADVDAARDIVREEVAGFLTWQRTMRVAPTVVALRAKADRLVRDELARLAARLPELDPEVAAELAGTVHRVVNSLLHAPTVRVKELAAGDGGEDYAAALRELFELDRGAPAAVSDPDPDPLGDPHPGGPR